MSDLTDYHEEVIMDRAFRGEDAPPAPQTLYVALHTDDPTNSGEENEVTSIDYVRQPISANDWTDNGNVAENTAVVEFGVADEEWGTITHATLWNGDQNDESANALWHTELETPKHIETDDEFRFNAGTLLYEVN